MRHCLIVLVLGLAACDRLLGIEDLEGPGDGSVDTPGPGVECTAQRVVHIVGGNGGLAWFTLLWPVPEVINNPDPSFAYDNRDNVKLVSMDPAHPLFARRTDATRALLEGLGQAPHPSVFVAGINETHTSLPQSTTVNGGISLTAAAGAMQRSLEPVFAVVNFRNQPYGAAPGSPSFVNVNDVEGAIGIFQGSVSPAVIQQLRPTAVQLDAYFAPGSATAVVTLGTQLAYTANAFRLGLIGTVLMPGFNDDPHVAFDNNLATPRTAELTRMVDAFYRDLALGAETTCGRNGDFLSLADNTVLLVSGDTPKNPFVSASWNDGTPGNANLLYVRSNGFTRPGWFGDLSPTMRTNFDPNTGQLAGVSNAISTAAAFAGALYAIARGDRTAIQAFTNAPFDGVIAP